MIILSTTLRNWIELLRSKLNDKINNSTSLLTEEIISLSQKLDVLISLYQRRLMNLT
ncbi:MAG: Spo0E family sporulation regulatory protein-aspartic acid phosphatase [Clostridiaceae bacterium]